MRRNALPGPPKVFHCTNDLQRRRARRDPRPKFAGEAALAFVVLRSFANKMTSRAPDLAIAQVVSMDLQLYASPILQEPFWLLETATRMCDARCVRRSRPASARDSLAADWRGLLPPQPITWPGQLRRGEQPVRPRVEGYNAGSSSNALSARASVLLSAPNGASCPPQSAFVFAGCPEYL
jgi:hypothetical protein